MGKPIREGKKIMQTYSISQKQTTVAVSARRILRGSGVFTRVTGAVTADDDGTPRALDIMIDADSLLTGISNRDQHLRTATFLDVARYPLATYHSQSIEQVGADRYTIHGDLRLHGQTHSITLDATLDTNIAADGARRVRVTGLVRRAAFGVPHSPILRTMMAGMIGGVVRVTADVWLIPVRSRTDALTNSTNA